MTALPPQNASLATGISWNAGSAGLHLVDQGGAGRLQPLRLGSMVGWRVHGPRCCTGIWLPDIAQRRPCPSDRTIPAATATSQCATCSTADPGRALARNFAVDDPRPFAVYLAWFGDELVKVGLTAVERESDRLSEQGAPAFTWLARGPFRAARRLEHAAASTGKVHERIPRSRKLAAWWHLSLMSDTVGDQLAAAHRALTTGLDWPPDLQPVTYALCDLTSLLGLDAPLPAQVREVTSLTDGTVLAGNLRVLAGHDAIIDTDAGSLLVDLRLLAGWILAPTDAPTSDVPTAPFDPGGGYNQDTLF